MATIAQHESREVWRKSREGVMCLNVDGMEKRQWSHDPNSTHEEQLASAVLIKSLNAFDAGHVAGYADARKDLAKQVRRFIEEQLEMEA